MTMSIFRRVLIPIEFESEVKRGTDEAGVFELGGGRWVRLSAETLEAVKLAGRLTMQYVELVHATPDLKSATIYGGAEGSWVPGPTMLELEAAARDAAHATLERIGTALLPEHEVTCHAAAGRPLDVIMDVAEERQPDVIVLAASARGRIRRAVVGSTANRIIRRSSCPVVVVPATDD